MAVISLADCVASQSIRVGGEAMDASIVDHLRRRLNLRIGLPTAERLRIELGSAYPLEEELTDEVRGVDLVSGLPRRAPITSEVIRDALNAPLERIVQSIKDTIDGCTPDLVGDLFDSGLVLCGGGALLRRLDRFLAERTGLPTRVSPEPLTCVARGTQICLEHLGQWRGMLESSDDDL